MKFAAMSPKILSRTAMSPKILPGTATGTLQDHLHIFDTFEYVYGHRFGVIRLRTDRFKVADKQ